MFGIERPYALLLLLLIIIPVSLFKIFKYKKIFHCLVSVYSRGKTENKKYAGLRKSVVLRSVFRFLAAAMIILAYAGISWGTETVPVQKNGDAVSFVFDISYSMMAKDAPDGLTRLEAAKRYAYSLLEKMSGTGVSIVLAKGDGFVAVPLTDDFFALQTTLESLSPEMMTSAGSSIGKGIEAGVRSFPQNAAYAAKIWVFTDGDETDGGLEKSLETAVKFGFPVTIVGFGTEKPVEIFAGDGKTKVQTYLNEKKLADTVLKVNEKFAGPASKSPSCKAVYVNASSESSAWKLLRQLSGKNAVSESTVTQNVPRHRMFIFLGVLFFICSYFAGEFDFSIMGKKSKKAAGILLLAGLFTSCDTGKTQTLSGVVSWHRADYQKATAQFLKVYSQGKSQENQILCCYSSYNLASSYIAQEEFEAAVIRLEQISSDCDAKLKSAGFYNLGVIAGRKGDFETAKNYYKKAILADSENINAKINLELTVLQVESQKAESAEAQMSAVNIENRDTALSNQIFSLIQQEEQKRWKNLQSDKKDSGVIDY